MGYSIETLRKIRGQNIGCEKGLFDSVSNQIGQIIDRMISSKRLANRDYAILKRYVFDMREVTREIARVLVPGGRATFVVGNSMVHNIYVKNSIAIIMLGQEQGLKVISTKSRRLPTNRRYLPSPSKSRLDNTLSNRIRTEVIITLQKLPKKGVSRKVYVSAIDDKKEI
jgi:hypothetical protein